ncbi:MAG: hypothetical protein K2N48_02570 [Muribaculaceae bacterium]|nr:hypothetical protein [Muribaculaceae bacterium]
MKKILMTLTLAFAAAIAIPAAAQSTTTATEQKNECCNDKKTCDKESCKEGKNCVKSEGKTCCKEAQSKQRKMKDGGKSRRGHKMDASRAFRKNKEMRRVEGKNPMFKGISLSEEQKTKMKALREKNKTAQKQSKAEIKAKSKEEMQKLHAEFEKEVEKILDKDQLKQYQANKAEIESKRAANKQK